VCDGSEFHSKCTNVSILTELHLCYSQARITECDLNEGIHITERGPGRLATQLNTPLPGFEAIRELQPFLSVTSPASSSEVFAIDAVVVIFVGLFHGQVQKVSMQPAACKV